jgi:hypothetical protein
MTGEEREQLILRYSKLVFKYAQSTFRRVGHKMRSASVDDFIQAGFVGVIDAIDRWHYPTEPPLANIIYGIRGEIGNLWRKEACARWANPITHVALAESDHPVFDPSQAYLVSLLLDQLIRKSRLSVAQHLVIRALLQGKDMGVIASERKTRRRSAFKVYTAAVRSMREVGG